MGGVARAVKKVVGKVLAKKPQTFLPTSSSASQDGAARTAEEETVGKEDERKEKRKRTSKGKLKVPMTAKQESTGVKV